MKKIFLLLLAGVFLAGITAHLAYAVTGTGNATLVLPSDGSVYTLDASSHFEAFGINPASFTFSLANGSVVKLSSPDKRLLNNSLNILTTCGATNSTLIINSAASQTVTITPGGVCSSAIVGFHVDNQNPNCSDAGSGTQTQPFCTITKAVGFAPATSTINVHAGTYREKIVITKSNITLQSYLGETAVIKGSDIISGWIKEAGKNVWSKNIPISEANILDPIIGGYQVCLPAVPLCRYPYQVFVDNVKLTKVDTGTDPGPGQFTWSGTGNSLIMRIGTDPASKLVEVSVRSQWIGATMPPGSSNPYDLPNNVTIRGLTFRHGFGGGESGIQPGPDRQFLCAGQSRSTSGDSCSADTGTGWVIENNDIGWAHGSGINLQSSLHTVRNNMIHHNSNLGVTGKVQNAAISFNTIHDNNVEGYNSNWAAGGLKIVISKTTTVSNNTVYNNTGIGIICDIVCNGITFANNRVYNNTDGIMYEISSNGIIKDNVVFDNKGQGIWISNADNTKVTGNVVVRNLFAQIFLLQDDRGAGFPNTEQNLIQNNTLIGDAQNAAQQQNLKALYTGGPNLLSTNTLDNNKLFRYGLTPTLYHWINQSYDTPAAFCAAVVGKECNSTVLTRAQADQVLVDNNIPLTIAQGVKPLKYTTSIIGAISASAQGVSAPTPVPTRSSPPPSLPRTLRKQGDTPVKPSSPPFPLPRVLRKQGDTPVKPSSPPPSLPRTLRKQGDTQVKSPSSVPPPPSFPPSALRSQTLAPEGPLSVKFSPGDRVQTTDALRVRLAPSLRGPSLGVQRREMKGTIIDAPVFSNRYTWWKIDFERGPDGWSAEDWLRKIITTESPALPLIRPIPIPPQSRQYPRPPSAIETPTSQRPLATPVPLREPAPSPLLNPESTSPPRSSESR